MVDFTTLNGIHIRTLSNEVAASTAAELDIRQNPFAVGIGCVVTGTINYDLQYSFDGTTWFNHADVTGQTASKAANIAFPVKSIRINQNSGTGSVVMTAIQALRRM